MSDLNFANNAATTLAANATSVATTLTVADASEFPSPPFHATLEDEGKTKLEIVEVTAVNGNDLTVIRAEEGTTAVTWSIDDHVQHRLTAEPLNAWAAHTQDVSIHNPVEITTEVNWTINPAGGADFQYIDEAFAAIQGKPVSAGQEPSNNGGDRGVRYNLTLADGTHTIQHANAEARLDGISAMITLTGSAFGAVDVVGRLVFADCGALKIDGIALDGIMIAGGVCRAGYSSGVQWNTLEVERGSQVDFLSDAGAVNGRLAMYGASSAYLNGTGGLVQNHLAPLLVAADSKLEVYGDWSITSTHTATACYVYNGSRAKCTGTVTMSCPNFAAGPALFVSEGAVVQISGDLTTDTTAAANIEVNQLQKDGSVVWVQNSPKFQKFQFTNYITTVDMDAHEAAPDPHPQYLTAEELPSTLTMWFSTDANALVPAYYNMCYQENCGQPEQTLDVLVNGAGVLAGEWLLNMDFGQAFDWYEAVSITFMDMEYISGTGTADFYAEGWVRHANGVEELIATSDTHSIEAGGYHLHQVTMSIQQFAGAADDRALIKLYFNRTGGGSDPTVRMYMQGAHNSRQTTTVPIAAYPAPHAVSHQSGEADELPHDNLAGAGTNTHAQIDSHIADTSIHFADAPADGEQYVRKDLAWAILTALGYDNGTTPPASPNEGDTWTNPYNGLTYQWYCDGDSCQWVATSSFTGQYELFATGNLILNGHFTQNTDGWVAGSGVSTATFTANAGKGEVDVNTDTLPRWVYSATLVAPGTTHRLKYKVWVQPTGSEVFHVSLYTETSSTGTGGTQHLLLDSDVAPTVHYAEGYIDYTATNGRVTIYQQCSNDTIVQWDDLELYQLDAVTVTLDFPNSPSEGDTYVDAWGVTWTFDGYGWVQYAPSRDDFEAHINDADIHYSDAPADGEQYVRKDNAWAILLAGDAVLYEGTTPPGTPDDKTLWFHTARGVVYKYYNDGNTTQWVAVAAVTGNHEVPLGSNYVTNGDFPTNTANWTAGTGVSTATFTSVGGKGRLAMNSDNGPRWVQTTALPTGQTYTLKATATRISGTEKASIIVNCSSTGTGGTIYDILSTTDPGPTTLTQDYVASGQRLAVYCHSATVRGTVDFDDIGIFQQATTPTGIDFPASPTINTTHVDDYGNTWLFDGDGWIKRVATLADFELVEADVATKIEATDVTYENLNANGDVGTGASQVAAGDHNHTGVYEPADAAIQSHLVDTSNPHSVTAAQAGADPAGTAASEVATHEGAANPHTGYLQDVDAGTGVSIDKTDTQNPIISATGQVQYNDWSLKTGNYTAVVGDRLIVNPASADITITLPASSSPEDEIWIKTTVNTGNPYKVVIARNGNKINAVAEDMDVLDQATFILTNVDATIGWST